MTTELSRADSVRRFLSGATSDGGVQTDPDAALGNFRSATQITELTFSVTSPISDVTVEWASGNNSEGAGTLTAIDSTTLAWTPPGGSQGPSVAIANGETKILEGGGGALDSYLRVSRTSATALTGAATVTLSYALNSLFDDKTSAEQAAGSTDYRCEVLKNVSTAQVNDMKAYLGTLGTDATSDTTVLPASGLGTIETTGSFADWPDSGAVAIYDGATLREIAYYTSRTNTILTIPAAGRGILGTSAAAGAVTDTVMAVPMLRIATETPSSQSTGFFQTIADEDTSPTSVTFSTPHLVADAISIGNVAAGNIHAIWYERETPVGATAEPQNVNILKFDYDAA